MFNDIRIMQKTNEIKITCSDNFELTGTLFEPDELKSSVMIAPATGIKRTFYHKFAKFLSENGFGVITFDNRGIGDSKGADLNAVDASLENWGRLDMTAVLEELKKRFPDSEYHLVGHSAGGQLAGLMENACELTSMFNFACSSGSLRLMKFPYRFNANFFMNFAVPVSNFLFGHMKSNWLGMGEPLPAQVAKDWRKWCNGKGYVAVDLDTKIKKHHYNDLKIPTLWLHADDDDIANIATVKDMIRVYPQIDAEIITLEPRDFDYKDIGHMKFFSSKRKKLWNFALKWLNKNH